MCMTDGGRSAYDRGEDYSDNDQREDNNGNGAYEARVGEDLSRPEKRSGEAGGTGSCARPQELVH